jgi:dipeptidyl aminopeptidase/acylaminoacyl peptidase
MKTALTLALVFMIQTLSAELPPLIPREVLLGNPDKASPRISPDGKRLAYLAPTNDVLNVWVRTLGQQDDQVITADKKRGIRIFFWQQDSEHIIYLQDQDGDENWHVHQTNLKTRNTRNLTPFQGVQAQVVAVDPNFPHEMLVGLNLEDRRLHDVYRIDLRTGAVVLDTKNPGDVAGWSVDNAMQVRVASVYLPDGGNELRLRDNPESAWHSWQRWSADETFGGVAAFTPDNRGAWIISSVDANAARLVEFDLAQGSQRVIAEDDQYDVDSLMIHPTRRTLEAVSFVRAREEWTLLDAALKPDFAALQKVRDGDFNVVSRDLADRTWIVSYTVDDGPVYFYAYDRGEKRADLLFSNRADLEGLKLARMRPISFTARDGLTIHGYLTLPVGLPARNLPMVLNVHGGPWGRDTWGLDPETQWLANRGYAVLQVNFRGSTGYGKKFLNAGDREWGRAMHHDLLDAKEWAVREGYADPDRVCIYGGSYGGYATLVGVTFTPDAFACGVDIVGPSSIVTLIKSIPPYWAPLKSVFDKRVGNVETEEEFLNARSPLFKADQIKVPLLIAQGANDPRVKQAESDQIVAAMRKNQKPVTYLVFPDEGHGFARPENRLKFYAAAEQFLATHLGGRAQPPGDAEKWDELLK